MKLRSHYFLVAIVSSLFGVRDSLADTSILSLEETQKWSLIPTEIQTSLRSPHRSTIENVLEFYAEDGVFFELGLSDNSLVPWMAISEAQIPETPDHVLFLVSPSFDLDGDNYIATAKLMSANSSKPLRAINVSSPKSEGYSKLLEQFWLAVDQPVPFQKKAYPRGGKRKKPVALDHYMMLTPDGNLSAWSPFNGSKSSRVIGLPSNHSQITKPPADSFPATRVVWGEGARTNLFSTVSVGQHALDVKHHEFPMLNEGILPSTITTMDIKYVQSSLPSSTVSKAPLSGRAAAVFLYKSAPGMVKENDLYFATFDTRVDCGVVHNCSNGSLEWINLVLMSTSKFDEKLGEGWQDFVKIRINPNSTSWAMGGGHGGVMLFHNTGLRSKVSGKNWETLESVTDALNTVDNLEHVSFISHPENFKLALSGTESVNNPGATVIDWVHSPIETGNLITTFQRPGWEVQEFDFSPDGRSIGVIWTKESDDSKIIQEVQLWDYRENRGTVTHDATFANQFAPTKLLTRKFATSRKDLYTDISFFSSPTNSLESEEKKKNNSFVVLHSPNGGYEVHRFDVQAKPSGHSFENTIVNDLYFRRGDGELASGVTPVLIDYNNNMMLEGEGRIGLLNLYPQVAVSDDMVPK